MTPVTLSGDHWTVRWYREYVRLGGFGRNPENLCRFLRVITVWAPLRWLFSVRKNEPPYILQIALVSFGTVGTIVAFFMMSVEMHDNYVKHGMSYFMLSEQDLLPLAIITGSIAAIVISIFVATGLWKLYKARYQYATAGAMCPFIDVDGGILPETCVGLGIDPIVAEAIDPDPLMDAAREVEAFMSQQYFDSTLIPVCLARLRKAISEESEDSDDE